MNIQFYNSHNITFRVTNFKWRLPTVEETCENKINLITKYLLFYLLIFHYFDIICYKFTKLINIK
jgi:hypothetical protein